jgi:ubiquinone/menaquinone biosynthesis C-methylase UbiE
MAHTDTGQSHKRDHQSSYQQHLDELKRSTPDRERSMQLAIGGEFRTMGILEARLLMQSGLPPEGHLIDVGCGSGRLSSQLAPSWKGSYLGIDILDELLTHARAITPRQDWRFVRGDGLTIPQADGTADMVCFFSVFTHLLHEESFVYLREARRVLRSGGKVVFSFLEFRISSHWAVFAQDVAAVGSHQVLNQFMSRDAIEAWARHLDFRIEAIHDGDRPHIAIDEPLHFDDGRRIEGMGALGQSVCILTKP